MLRSVIRNARRRATAVAIIVLTFVLKPKEEKLKRKLLIVNNTGFSVLILFLKRLFIIYICDLLNENHIFKYMVQVV
jgi:hypothetical protein